MTACTWCSSASTQITCTAETSTLSCRFWRRAWRWLFRGIENESVPGVVTSLKVASEKACTRIAKYAFAYAVRRKRKKVTVFHKANIMKLSDGLFLDCARRVHQQEYPNVAYDEVII